jgi:hypothetical protein
LIVHSRRNVVKVEIVILEAITHYVVRKAR